MNSEYDSNMHPLLDLESAELTSLDDFIKELEAKEKDLHISSEMVVEVEQYDADVTELEEMVSAYAQNPSELRAAPSTFQNPELAKASFSDLSEEVSKLRNEIAKSDAEKNEIKETFRRRQTDFENFRKRTDRERSEIFRSVLSNLAIKLLPVMDNLSRAIDTSARLPGEKSPDFQNFVDGIQLVNHQLSEVLEDMTIQPIISLGKPFDPNFHEAVATVATDRVPHNTVVEELMRGYRIDDKIIRAAVVKVSSSSAAQAAVQTQDAD